MHRPTCVAYIVIIFKLEHQRIYFRGINPLGFRGSRPLDFGQGVVGGCSAVAGRTQASRGGRGRVVTYYCSLSCTESMFESGDF